MGQVGVPARRTASRAPMTPPAMAPPFGLDGAPPLDALAGDASAVRYVGEPVRKPDTAPRTNPTHVTSTVNTSADTECAQHHREVAQAL